MSSSTEVDLDQLALNNFREYLQIKSVHPNVDYDESVEFLRKQAKSLDLQIKVIEVSPKKPIVVLTWVGENPKLPSIMLNSHMDVVPVYEDHWTHDPFEAKIIDGKIIARGAQDMKCVGIQYLEAVRRLRLKRQKLTRTLHITFVPDEETGGKEGMEKFVKSKEFLELNIGAAFDEGLASENEEFIVFYGEKCVWQFSIHCPGTPGHGSSLMEETAGGKVRVILDNIYKFREEQVNKLKNNPSLRSSDVTSINVTKLEGGIQTNVIPQELVVVVDCRLPVTVDLKKWEETINSWCRQAGSDVWIEFEQKQPQIPHTNIDALNQYWVAFKNAADELGLKLNPIICPAITDIRHIRALGLSALGFSPICNTPMLAHAHNEYLGVDTFLKGINIFSKIITSISNVTEK